MIIYICHFKFMGDDKKIESEDGSIALYQGFWLDNKLKLTVSFSKRKIWIPPHKIEYIERVHRD